jgi:hypothetical protein
MSELVFDAKVEQKGIDFLGYLYLSPLYSNRKYIGLIDIASKFKYDKKFMPKKYNFELIIAKLYKASEQKIFQQGDQDKESFCILGKYKGQSFSLTDYKADGCIRINGAKKLDVEGLRGMIKHLLKNTEPKEFEAKLNYEKGKKYSYKCV